jgi:cyclophilin family peptidyl-prolyl cis-trans isomerase
LSKQRRRRRRFVQQPDTADLQKMEMPGPLRLMTNPKVFALVGLVFGGVIIFSLLAGGIVKGNTGQTNTDISQMQQNAVEDKPAETPAPGDNTVAPNAATPAAARRYDSPPARTIDPAKSYQATVKTTKGDIQIQLDAKSAPDAVNSFAFLAHEGYYDNTPFMKVASNPDGSKFTAQAGDPTGTGLGSPGYFINKESTTTAFARGAVGMGGAAGNSNGGQFFISYGDYPALTNKYTIFGRVVAGMDVADKLNLLDLTKRDQAGSVDKILSVDVQESVG